MEIRADLRIRSVTDPDDPILDGALAIYEESIAAAERKPSAAVRALASSAHHRILIAEQSGAALGFCLLFIGESAALLEYLAVELDARGGGIGALLFERAAREVGSRPLLVEVEADSEGTDDQATRGRRIAFYRRLSCRQVEGLDYLLPLVPAGEAHPMYLLATGVDDESVSRATVLAWLQELYARVYGEDADDFRITYMLAGLPESVALA